MKVAAYARYSTNNQTENSIAYQLEKINEYCNKNNIEISKIYIDKASSGTNTNRKGFNDMITDAKRKLFEAVIVYDTSRGSRDVGDWFNFRKSMMMLGIQIISCTQNLGQLDNPNDFLTELISVGLGQHMVLETRQKSIAGVASRAKEGKFLGGIAPLGYDIINGKYVINTVDSRIVRKIFAMYASGDSYDDIIIALNGAKGKKGRPLGKNTISVMLRNERYIGTYTWNKRKMKFFTKWAGGKLNPNVVKIENSIPAIIDIKTWEAVQMRLNNKSRRAVNKAKREYLLSGLIECAECGSTYIGHTSTKNNTKKKYEYVSYVCGNKYRTRQCHSKNINANELETFVVAHLKKYLSETNFKEMAEYIAEKINATKIDLSSEKKELRQVETKIKNGINAILAGAEIPELQTEIDVLRNRKNELTEIINVAENKNYTINQKAIEEYLSTSVEDLENTANLKAIVQKHITKIYANTDGTITVNIGVHIDDSGRGI